VQCRAGAKPAAEDEGEIERFRVFAVSWMQREKAIVVVWHEDKEEERRD
jgi:hypothetical protein